MSAYDNAAAEAVKGLFKNESMDTGSPFQARALKIDTMSKTVPSSGPAGPTTDAYYSSMGHQTPEDIEQTNSDENLGL